MIANSFLKAVLIWVSLGSVRGDYVVSLERANGKKSVVSANISSGDPGFSTFDWNYNSAVFPVWDEGVPHELSTAKTAMLVRVQDIADPKDPYTPTPSQLAFTVQTNADPTFASLQFQPISQASVVFKPTEPEENFGTEDPRVVWNPKDDMYYMFYTAAEKVGETVTARLNLATTTDPSKNNWHRYGCIFEDVKWSKSGALLLEPEDMEKTFLFWGDDFLHIARPTTAALTNYTQYPQDLINLRPYSFDSHLIEGGPPPAKLSDGNYFMLYNSARDGYPSHKPHYQLQYNVGWVVLDGKDPRQVVARSERPLLTPETPEETEGLTPNVVFAEGWRELGNDRFLVFYGGADSVMLAAVVSVGKKDPLNTSWKVVVVVVPLLVVLAGSLFFYYHRRRKLMFREDRHRRLVGPTLVEGMDSEL